MGKMGKIRTNTCIQKTSNRRNGFHSKIEQSIHNSVHTLQEKYKNILGSMQPVVVLEKCLVSKNILHQNSLRVSLNNTHNANYTSNVDYSTNHISHQSPCVEKTNNHKSAQNLRADYSKSSKNRTRKRTVKKIDCSLRKVSLNSEASDISKTSRVRLKRGNSLKSKNSIPKNESTSSLDKIMEGYQQKTNLKEKIILPKECKTNKTIDSSVKRHKRRKIYIRRTDSTTTDTDTIDFPMNGTSITETRNKELYSSEYLDILPLQERLIMLRCNYLSKHKKKRTVVSSSESAKADDTSSMCTRNSYTSTLILPASKNLNAINLEERLTVPSSNELSKHTKKHVVKQSQKSTMIEDTEDVDSDTDIIQPSKRIMPSSNQLSEHTKKHSVADTENSKIIRDPKNMSSASAENFINSFTDTVQSSKRIIMPISSELSKYTKKHTVTHTQKSTITEDIEDDGTDTDTDTVQSSKCIIVPRGNELSKHTKTHTVEHTQENIKMGDAEGADTVTVQSCKGIIIPVGSEFSRHTKKYTVKHAQKGTIIEDTEDADIDTDTDTVQSSKSIIMPCSNELSKHTKTHTVQHTQENIIMGDTEGTDTVTVQSYKGIIIPNGSELSKHTNKHMVTHTKESTIIEGTEDADIDTDTDTVQSSKSIIMPNSNELSKHTKTHTVEHTQESIIIEDAEDIDTVPVQSSKKFMPSSNQLSKHTKGHTMVHTQKNTIVGDSKDTEDASFASTINLIDPPTDTVQSSKGIIKSSNNELRHHTKKHTVPHSQKRSKVGDTKDIDNASCSATRNFINPPTDTVKPSERFITSRSTDSKKQTKESTTSNNQKTIKLKEKVSKENNAQHDTTHHKHEHESSERRKRVHSTDSNSSRDLKKVKLNRSSWRRPLETTNETVDASQEEDKTETIVKKLKNNGKIPQLIRTDDPGPSVAFPEEGNITYDVQVVEANLTEERGVSSIEKQISTETFGYSNSVECDVRKDARKSQNAATAIRALQNAATEIHKSDVENTSFVSEDANFNNSSSQDDEDDCISLFADSMLVDEYDTILSPPSRKSSLVKEKPYVMTDNVMDKFYKRNALEFNEAYSANYSNNIMSRLGPRTEKPAEIFPQRKDRIKTVPPVEPPVQPVPLMRAPAQPVPLMKAPSQPVPLMKAPAQPVPLMKAPSQPVPLMKAPAQPVPLMKAPAQLIPLMKVPDMKSITARLTLNSEKQINPREFVTTFRGFCFTKLRCGTCNRNNCHYKHDLTAFLMLLYDTNETCFMEAINNLVQKKCRRTLQIFYKECINSNANFICILKLLKILCDSGMVDLKIIHNSIEHLITRGVAANEIVGILATIVNANDTQFVTYVSNAIVSITRDDTWPMLKPLLTRINILGERVVRFLLSECIRTEKYIPDVYENVVRKLHNYNLSQSTLDLVAKFCEILRRISRNVEVQKSVAYTSDTISSPTSSNEPKVVPYMVQTGNLSPKVWYNCIDDNNNAQRQNSTRLLHPTDNIPSPYSGRSREHFWKFYLNVHSLQEGLKHKDYKHVKKILDEAQEGDASLFTRACYKILWSNVEHSPTHLRELASLAVRDGATATFSKILIDVTIHILVDLAARELWILALELLKSFEVILHERSLMKFDAVVTMLFCEIYLANRKPMKAYTLLKQSNIIYTYRGKWKVRNNEKDENIRAQIVTILLQMLCDTSPQYAYSLFEFLIADQSSNFKPIDLSYQANKLVSSLLLRKDHELIVSIGELINSYNCTLFPITYRQLITSLVHIDLSLAKQLYQIALLLGIYSKIQLEPMIYIIIKSDWTSEEMYLAISVMMQELFENLGHAINGVKPFNLPVYLVFEGTPSDKLLICDKETSKQYENKIKGSIELMKMVLETKFDPPLSMVTKRKGKFQKLNSMNLCRYLVCNQNFMQSI